MAGLRVIGGTARGHVLKDVPGDSTRPITGEVKEALFNIIRVDLPGGAFLDVFAGTGSVGIEALSRGAAYARFWDLERAAVSTTKANLQHTKLEEKADVLQGDAFALLKRQPDRAFDYVFIAPPQFKGLWSKALLTVDANPGWLVDDAWVIVQVAPKEYEVPQLENLAEFDQRKYGNTMLVFFERVESD